MYISAIFIFNILCIFLYRNICIIERYYLILIAQCSFPSFDRILFRDCFTSNINFLFDIQAPGTTRPIQRPPALNLRLPTSVLRQFRRHPKRRRTFIAAVTAVIRTQRAPSTSIWFRNRFKAATIVTRSARTIISSVKIDTSPPAAVAIVFKLLPELSAFTLLLIAIRRHAASPRNICPCRSPRIGSPVA